MCTVLLPPGVNPTAVNKIYHIISYHNKDEEDAAEGVEGRS
jgi:hypothetical protein